MAKRAPAASVRLRPQNPFDLIRLLAPHPLRYVGLIGSRGKWARFRNRLAERGVPAAALDRVHCPVGLDIGALTPEEIAVSVVAEMIRVRRVGT